MVSQISIATANLVTVILESMFYGVFVLLSIASIHLLTARERRMNKQATFVQILIKPLILANIGISCSVLIHWIFGCIRLFQAFLLFNGGTTPARFYGNLTEPTYLGRVATLMTSIVFCDSMMFYRLWVVWSKSRLIIIFPGIALAGMLVTTVGITYECSRFKPGEEIFASGAGKWIRSGVALTLATDLYCSCLIAYKIIKINSSVHSLGAPSLKRVVAIIIESAAFYTAWVIGFLVTYELQSNAQFTVVDLTPDVAGISFMLMNVWIGLGWAQKSASHQQSTASAFQTASAPWTDRLQRSGNRNETSLFELNPISINVSRSMETDTDTKLQYGHHDGKPETLTV